MCLNAAYDNIDLAISTRQLIKYSKGESLAYPNLFLAASYLVFVSKFPAASKDKLSVNSWMASEIIAILFT